MKRYLLFAGQNYYALGGAEDYVDSFDSLIAAKEKWLVLDDWYNIFDTRTGKQVPYDDLASLPQED